jgi:hypothetical protein
LVIQLARVGAAADPQSDSVSIHVGRGSCAFEYLVLDGAAPGQVEVNASTVEVKKLEIGGLG